MKIVAALRMQTARTFSILALRAGGRQRICKADS